MSEHEQLNLTLRQEISALTPNRLDDLLSRLGPQQAPETTAPAPRRSVRAVRRYLVAAVLALVLLGSGVFYLVRNGQRSVVIIDADASVAFTVNGFNRVCSVELENARASAVVDAERYDGMLLPDAITALTDQLVEGACITPTESAVLLSVREDGTKRADQLAGASVNALRSAAASHDLEPVILLQTLPEDQNAAPGVGSGKAALVDKLIGNEDAAHKDTLRRASVGDLIYFADARGYSLADTTRYGSLSPSDFYAAPDAVAVACDAAGCAPDSANAQAVLGWQDSDLVYIVTLQRGEQYVYYCISARTGEVLDSFLPEAGQPIPEPQQTVPQGGAAAPAQGGASTPSTPAVPSVPNGGNASAPSLDIRSFVQMIEFWDDII